MGRLTSLVTGGTGFLGRYLVRRLAESGYDITLLARRPIEPYRTIVADLRQPELPPLDAVFDEVYHLAGLAHTVPASRAAGERFFQVNTEGTHRLLEALERAGRPPGALVYISSVAVYGLEEGSLLDEETPRRASDPYGASKREAEDLVMEWSARHQVRASIVRLPLVVGRGAPGNLRAMIEAMCKRRYWGVSPGTARRSMVAAADVSEILPRLARTGGVFHLTDGEHPSFAELEEALAAALGRKAPRRLPGWIARLAAWAGDVLERVTGVAVPINSRVLRKMTSTLTFSDGRARRTLSWKPTRVLDRLSELVA